MSDRQPFIKKESKMLHSDVSVFVTAGNATFTLESGETGARYTYRVTKAQDSDTWFVGVMLSNDNEKYSYIAYFRKDMVLRTSPKARLSWNSKPVIVFRFFMERLNRLPSNLHVYHACKCGRCGRTLTTPESILSGIGPECRKMMSA